MEKCEKEERFEEAATARDRILKLKKIENKRTLEDLKLKQTQELDLVKQRYNDDISVFNDVYSKQTNSLDESNKEAVENLSKRHEAEKAKLVEEFNAKYPPQPKFSSEVLNLQKIMEGHIKNQQYEKANEIKIKILNLCEEQDNKHNSDVKNQKLSSEMDKLTVKHENEMFSLKKKHSAQMEELVRKFEKEKEKLNLKFNNRINELQLSHISQINDQNKLNKKNLNTKLTPNSKSIYFYSFYFICFLTYFNIFN
jgi:hypothetical protein